MYICGPPGTGKTALMNEIFSEYKECQSKQNIDAAFINCMSFGNPEDTFDRIIDEFNTNAGSIDSQLEYLFLKRKTMLYKSLQSNL